jgi:hypothetical protein
MKKAITLALLFVAPQVHAGGVSVSSGHATFGGVSVSVSPGHTTFGAVGFGAVAAAVGKGSSPAATSFGLSTGKTTATATATTMAAVVGNMGAALGAGIGNTASGATATP